MADNMTDREFIQYVEAHSETDRALFHIDHVKRLFELAGKPLELGQIHPKFVAMHSDDPDVIRMLERAWARVKATTRIVEMFTSLHNSLAMRMDSDDPSWDRDRAELEGLIKVLTALPT